MMKFWSFPAGRAFLVLFCFFGCSRAQEHPKKYLQFDHAPSSSRIIPSVIKYQPDHRDQRHVGHAHVRPARQLNSLTSTNLQAAAASDYGYGVAEPVEFGGYAQAGSHGGGYGHGGGGGHGNGVNSSAVGLLGFLALLSLIQNILRQMTTTMGGRRKRDVEEGPNGDSGVSEALRQAKAQSSMDIDKITLHVVPYLMRIGQVLDGSAPLKCSLHAVCSANQLLAREVGGGQGHFIGRMISDGIINMLARKYGNGGRGSKNSGKSNKKMLGEVANAGFVGRNSKNCDAYRKCSASSIGGGLSSRFPAFLSKFL